MRKELRRWGVAALAGMALIAVSASSAWAQETVSVTESDDSYGYTFGDELLQGDGLDSSAPRIEVRTTGRRDRLIRPRVHFVRELLMSVENL